MGGAPTRDTLTKLVRDGWGPSHRSTSLYVYITEHLYICIFWCM